MGISVRVDEDTVVVWGNSPVLRVVVLIWVVLLVDGEVGVQLQALLEILGCLEATDVLEVIEVTEGVNASLEESVPVDALELHVGVVDLEGEVERLTKVDVWTLNSVCVLTRSLKLVELEVLWEHFHFI